MPGDGIRTCAGSCASTSNSAGTPATNCWNVAARDCANVAWSSPTCTSDPSCARSRRASLSPNPSTRVVFPLNTSGPTVNSMKSVNWLVGLPRWNTIRPAEFAGMSTNGCSAIEWVCPPKVQNTWLSGKAPLVRLSTLTMSTFWAGGMDEVSPQNASGGGVVGAVVRTASSHSE